MTIASLLIGTFTFQVILALLKIFFIGSFDLDNKVVITLFFALIIVVAIATVRRMGILNYLESFFLAAVWLLTALMVDYVITANFTSFDIYKTWYYWFTHLAVILTVLTFHKSLHVEVRKSNKK